MMTTEQIKQWAKDHISIPHRLAYNDDNGYKMQFASGDTYEYTEREYSISGKTVDIRINGELVNTTRYKYDNFGWIAV